MIKRCLVILMFFIFAWKTQSHAFWKTCINIDAYNTSVWVVDPDIMAVKNLITNEFAFVSIECPLNNLYEHPFSRCANGCPLYPDSSIRIPFGKHKLCEGDIIFIYNKKCRISSMTKGKDK